MQTASASGGLRPQTSYRGLTPKSPPDPLGYSPSLPPKNYWENISDTHTMRRGMLKMLDIKQQERKQRHQNAAVELTARNGNCGTAMRGWKMRDKKIRERLPMESR